MHRLHAVITIVVVVLAVLAAMVLLVVKVMTSRRSNKSQSAKGTNTTNPAKQADRLSQPMGKENQTLEKNWWTWPLPAQPSPQQIPTVTGFIKAGDEGVYSSTLFDRIVLEHARDNTYWELVYKDFADSLSARPAKERSRYPHGLHQFMSNPVPSAKRRSLTLSRATEARPPLAARNSIDGMEKGLVRSWSKKVKREVDLVSSFNPLSSASASVERVVDLRWANDLQLRRRHHTHTAVTVKADELEAFALILGMRISPLQESPSTKDEPDISPADRIRNIGGTGAFGLKLSGSPTEDGNYRIQITQTDRPISQYPSRGSGYSTLHAKHLPYGSLPISQDTAAVNSLLITDETVEMLKSGSPLHMQRLRQTPLSKPMEALSTLPSSKLTAFHTIVRSSSPDSPGTTALIGAIAALPFTGGLTPFASPAFIRTISFIASGGLAPGRLLQRLENLVQKIHRQAPHLKLFGPLLEEGANTRFWLRELRRLGSIREPGHEDIAAGVARVGRYVTLLERLMALLVREMGADPVTVRNRVQDALKEQLSMSYAHAVQRVASGIGSGSPTPTSPVQQHLSPIPATPRSDSHVLLSDPPSPVSVSSLPRTTSYTSRSSYASSAAAADGIGGNRTRTRAQKEDLARVAEEVLKRKFPLDVETVATVARLVLVAWTLSVGVWKEGDGDVWREVRGGGVRGIDLV